MSIKGLSNPYVNMHIEESENEEVLNLLFNTKERKDDDKDNIYLGSSI